MLFIASALQYQTALLQAHGAHGIRLQIQCMTLCNRLERSFASFIFSCKLTSSLVLASPVMPQPAVTLQTSPSALTPGCLSDRS